MRPPSDAGAGSASYNSDMENGRAAAGPAVARSLTWMLLLRTSQLVDHEPRGSAAAA